MTQTTDCQLEDHINSKDWDFVETKYISTPQYDSHIGVLRLMFNLEEDPKAVTTLLSKSVTEVWIKTDTNWQKIFPVK